MKSLQNPTTYFFKQAQNPPNPYKDKIEAFVKNLINKKTCLLCKEDFNLGDRIPRIMIHCGHSFCSLCLLNFFMQPFLQLSNRRVRCPMCLKLVKQLNSIERLPINHTIFTELVEADIAKCKELGIEPQVTDASKFLFSEFERVQGHGQKQDLLPGIDPDSGLPFCASHPERVEHFFCRTHKATGCRVCAEIGHTQPECAVIDLYDVEDPKTYLQQHMPAPQPINIRPQGGPDPNGQEFHIPGPDFDDDEEDDQSLNSI